MRFRGLIGEVAAIAVACLSPVAAAEDGALSVHEVNLGILDHDTDNLWSGFSRESGVDYNAEVLFGSIYEVLSGNLHPAVGVSINSEGDTSKIYAGLRYRYEFEAGFFLGAGLGAAVHNGETELVQNDKKALGSKLLFHIPFEVGYRLTDSHTTSLYFDHVSNAYTQDANEGLDTLGIRFGYRF